MACYKLSASQLESCAEDLLKQFDPERLIRTKPLDVYEVVEKCLDVPYDWKYLTPDQSILGMTAFNSGYLWVWKRPYYSDGDLPYKIGVKQGTILIDATLTESDNRGRENFTVIHETFHQVIHKNFFSKCQPDYIHSTTAKALNGKKALVDDIDFIEYQANTCAAAFLMPKQLVKDTFQKCYGGSDKLSAQSQTIQRIISILAPEFNVSKQAMQYRLENLHLIDD